MLFLFVLPINTQADDTSIQKSSSELLQMPDIRVVAIQSFLNSHKCGSDEYDFTLATDFISSADTNNIDWRILPIIFWKESNCGRHGVNGNYFGYMPTGSLRHFDSIPETIIYISEKLTESPYKGKPLYSQMSTYGGGSNYWYDFKNYYDNLGYNLKLIKDLQNNVLVSQ